MGKDALLIANHEDGKPKNPATIFHRDAEQPEDKPYTWSQVNLSQFSGLAAKEANLASEILSYLNQHKAPALFK